jgi:hypothetical protein
MCINCSFSLLSSVSLYQRWFNHSSVERCLNCFHLESVTNKDAANIRVRFLCEPKFLSL